MMSIKLFLCLKFRFLFPRPLRIVKYKSLEPSAQYGTGHAGKPRSLVF